jgi:uncharacterized protein (DUF433 family)
MRRKRPKAEALGRWRVPKTEGATPQRPQLDVAPRCNQKKERLLEVSNCSKVGELKEKSMTDPARIVLDSAILAGKPVIRGTRLSVDFVIGLMADGWTEADILRNYPGLSHDDVAACLAYARDVLRSEKVYPSAA